MNKILYTPRQIAKDFNLYLKDSYIFLVSNKKYYFIYLAFYILFELLHLYDKLYSASMGCMCILSILAGLLQNTYYYALPIFFLNTQLVKPMNFRYVYDVLLQILRRSILPFLISMILIIVGLILLTSFFNLKIMEVTPINNRQWIGFNPSNGLVGLIEGSLAAIFIFSPVLFSLKNQTFFGSLKNSAILYSKNLRFTIPLTLIFLLYSSIIPLFVPEGNIYLRFFSTVLISFLGLLLFISTYLYYSKNFRINTEKIFSKSIADTEINVGVIYRRVLASVIDIFLWLILLIFPIIAINEQTYIINPFIIYSLALFSYYVILEWLIQGTFGKIITGIKVVNMQGERITFWQSFVRNCLRIVDALPYAVPYFVALLVIAADNNKQRLGDKLAHTLVSKYTIG